MKITIITGPFLSLPPETIGAVEKLWYGVGNKWIEMGYDVEFISKMPKCPNEEPRYKYVKGYERTGSWIKDFILDFFYSFRAMFKVKKTDILILNSLWSPILSRLFRFNHKIAIFSIERFPKNQLDVYRKIGGVDYFRCNSTAVYDAVLQQSAKSAKNTIIVPNYIDIETFKCHSEKEKNDRIVIAYAGRIHEEKGLELLFRAANQVANKDGKKITLRMIGARDEARGGSGENYAKQIEKLAPQCLVEWINPIYDPKVLSEVLNNSDIFCYPSIAEKGETFGVAPLEAMGLGLPTIVSDLDCFKDFVKDKENALVFNHRSNNAIEELKNCILQIVNDKDLKTQISSEAVVTAQKFCVESIAQQYIFYFSKFLKEQY